MGGGAPPWPSSAPCGVERSRSALMLSPALGIRRVCLRIFASPAPPSLPLVSGGSLGGAPLRQTAYPADRPDQGPPPRPCPPPPLSPQAPGWWKTRTRSRAHTPGSTMDRRRSRSIPSKSRRRRRRGPTGRRRTAANKSMRARQRKKQKTMEFTQGHCPYPPWRELTHEGTPFIPKGPPPPPPVAPPPPRPPPRPLGRTTRGPRRATPTAPPSVGACALAC